MTSSKTGPSLYVVLTLQQANMAIENRHVDGIYKFTGGHIEI